MKIANTGGVSSPKSSKAKARRVVLILAIAVLAVAIFFISAVVMKYAKGKAAIQNAQEFYNPTNTSSGGIWKQPEEVRNPDGITQDFWALKEHNDDVIGWLDIPGTKLDVPVVMGDDNMYYLDKTVDKKDSPFGVPFADYRTVLVENFQSTNITIHGHAAKDGTYFSAIKEYKDVNFYKEHPTLNFNTIYGKGVYKIIGTFMEDVRPSNPDVFNYHNVLDMSGDRITEFVDNVTKRSYFTTDVDFNENDSFITLSTCDTELDSTLATPYRIVLVARKVRDGEKVEVNTNAAESNTDMIMPKGWIDKKGKLNPYK